MSLGDFIHPPTKVTFLERILTSKHHLRGGKEMMKTVFRVVTIAISAAILIGAGFVPGAAGGARSKTLLGSKKTSDLF